MRHVALIITLLLSIGGWAHAQDAWYEAAESSAVNYEINAAKQIVGEGTAQLNDNVVAARAEAERVRSIDSVHNIENVAASVEAVQEPSGYWVTVDCGDGPSQVWVKREPGCALVAIPVCFAEDTIVRTVGGTKKISDIKEGDMVQGKDGFKEVTRVLKSEGHPTISINGIETTDSHLFIMEGGDFLKARDLRVGDTLYGGIKVMNVERISSQKRLYNIDLEGDRFYVGDLLVHNSLVKRVSLAHKK